MSKSALYLLIHYALFSLLLATVIRGRSMFLEKEMDDELQPTNTEVDETESDLHEIDILGCQDILDDCSSLKPKDCYHDYYALGCCQTCRLFIQNLVDTNCLYGDKIVGSEIVGNVGKKVCRNFSMFLEKEKDDELQPTNTEVDEKESYWPEIDILVNSNKKRNSRFRKRSTEKEEKAEKRLMTIELFTVMEYSIFEKFFAESNAASDAEKRKGARTFIYYFFTHIMEDVKKMYESIKSNRFKFTIKWVGAFIAETPEDLPIFEPGKPPNADYALESLQNWIVYQRANKDGEIKIPNYDMVVAFTRHNMEDAVGVKAMTFGGVCGHRNNAIVRYNMFSTLAIATAHEIGHLLGVSHVNLCFGEERWQSEYYPKPSKYSRLFSSCSESYLNAIISMLDEDDENCLTDGGGLSEHREKEIFLNLHLGQIYDLDEQCKIEFGPESFYIGGPENDNLVCQKISCLNGNYTFKAMDGTPCSNGAWCLEGECVLDSRAPKVPDNCINGDKQYRLDSETNQTTKIKCKTNIKKRPGNCRLDQFRTDCCLSCAQDRTLRKGCQDTLDDCSSLEPKDCYHNYYASACCKTCRLFAPNLSDTNCLYGDRIVGCSDMVPEVCHISSKLCCKTCSDYVSSNKTATSTVSTAGQNNFDFCSQGDYQDNLEVLTVWGDRWLANCTQLVDHDPSLCYDSIVRKYCCASCSNVELVKNYCKHDTQKALTHKHKKFTCRKLVAYNPRLCEKVIQKHCCESCRFTVRPPKSE